MLLLYFFIVRLIFDYSQYYGIISEMCHLTSAAFYLFLHEHYTKFLMELC